MVARLGLAQAGAKSVSGVVTGVAALHPLAVAVVKARIGGQAVAFHHPNKLKGFAWHVPP